MKPSDGLDWLKDEAVEWAKGQEEFVSIGVNDFAVAVFSALEERDGLWAELDAYNGLGTDEEGD